MARRPCSDSPVGRTDLRYDVGLFGCYLEVEYRADPTAKKHQSEKTLSEAFMLANLCNWVSTGQVGYCIHQGVCV